MKKYILFFAKIISCVSDERLYFVAKLSRENETSSSLFEGQMFGMHEWYVW